MFRLLKIATASLLLMATAASADPWKDESSNGRDRPDYGHYDDRYDRDDHDRYDRDNRRHRSARVPAGHLPPPGMCRVWLRNRPAGQQPAPMSCRQAGYYADRYGGRVVHGGRRH